MKSNSLILFIIILTGSLAQIASDIYTPSVPAITLALHTQLSAVQWSMAIYMLGLSLSLLFYGPLSEMMGRKKPLIIGLILFIVGAVVSISAEHITQLSIGRLLQGLGAGACACMWRSIFRDLYSGNELAKYSAYLTMIVAFVIPVAPALGGYLQHYIGWRASFGFILLYALINLIAIVKFLPETIQEKIKLTTHTILNGYLDLFKNRIFMGTTISVFLTYGAFFSWFVASPILFIHQLKVSVITYGWVSFIIAAVAYLLGGKVNTQLVGRWGSTTMLRIGWSLIIVTGIYFILSQAIIGLSFWGLCVGAFIFFFGTTFIWPNTFAAAFTAVTGKSGFASAIYSFIQILGGAFLGGVIAYLPDHDAYPVGLSILIAAILAWLIYESVALGRKRLP